MVYTDKQLTCADCSKEFVFSSTEQEFFASKGFSNEPKRCPDCRQVRKASRNGNGSANYNREMHTATCAQCGKQTQIPFEPRDGRPVYCSECYTAIKVRR